MSFRDNGTKNLRHIWTILASSSILDADTNNLSVNNLVERLTINIGREDVERRKEDKTQGYAVPIQLQLITRVMKKIESPVSFTLKFELFNPEGTLIQTTKPFEFKMTKEMRNARIRTGVTPLPVNISGEYVFKVYLKEGTESEYVEVDHVPLDVDIVEASPVTQ